MNRFSTLACLALLAGCTASARGEWPLPQASLRPTPLHFGLYVTPDPAQNPIDPPERFTGYHAATDFEIFRGEVHSEIPVYAICTGPVLFSGFSEGYGGLLTQRCILDGEPVHVIYGHLEVASLPGEQQDIGKGESIGVLGAAHTNDTDQNRKHLHLGIRKGDVSDVRGYVEYPEELQLFIDPQTVLGTGRLE